MLEIECLEDRLMPANITVTAAINVGDAAIVQASETGSEVTITTNGSISNWSVGDVVTVNGVANGSAYNVEGAAIDSVSGNQLTYEAAGGVTGLPTINNSGVVTDLNQTVGPLSGSERSMVDNIVYTFSEPVILGPIAINTTVHPGQPGSTPATALTTDDNIHWVLTFENGSGASAPGGSIGDGVYDSTIDASKVTPVLSDGDTMAANRVDTFWRLYGDLDGNETVNNADSRAFSQSFNQSNGSSQYVPAFDYNDDGTINNADSRHFAQNFNVTYSGFTPTI